MRMWMWMWRCRCQGKARTALFKSGSRRALEPSRALKPAGCTHSRHFRSLLVWPHPGPCLAVRHVSLRVEQARVIGPSRCWRVERGEKQVQGLR
ncbi:hypothetical protein N431DRAFT_34574 [Stipitochalara longipes BDJ]|nr:hypothetical protein N431DRAFT_34574 [Stipitochalara longipes BDJ]